MAIQKLLQVGEVAALAGRGAAKVRQAAEDGRIPVAAVTGYGQRLFLLEDAEAWARSLPPRMSERRCTAIARPAPPPQLAHVEAAQAKPRRRAPRDGA